MNKAEQMLEKHINENDLNFIFHEKKDLWQELLNAMNEALVLSHVSHRLLRELRQTYLVNVDDNGQPKASIVEIMDIWDRVNRELQIVTID